MSYHAYDRAAELTYKIGQSAQRRQLTSAKRTFERFAAEGVAPTLHTYTNLLNAHVVAGDIVGARATCDAIAASGFAPNVVAYTTLLKGHCAVGDLRAARAVLEEMAASQPPVLPDATLEPPSVVLSWKLLSALMPGVLSPIFDSSSELDR